METQSSEKVGKSQIRTLDIHVRYFEGYKTPQKTKKTQVMFNGNDFLVKIFFFPFSHMKITKTQP